MLGDANTQVSPKDLISYVLLKTSRIHPFRISRIIGLAEILYYEKTGRRLTDLSYKGFNGVFYIEGLKEIIENDKCFERIEGDPAKGVPGCIKYTCEEPFIPEEVKNILLEAIDKSKTLSDHELNDLVVNNPVFRKLIMENK